MVLFRSECQSRRLARSKTVVMRVEDARMSNLQRHLSPSMAGFLINYACQFPRAYRDIAISGKKTAVRWDSSNDGSG
jgi:hypothetical protein